MVTMTAPLDVHAIRSEFPLLGQSVNGQPLVYLDSGATSQKPRTVLDAQFDYLSGANAAVHRGAHTLAAEATNLYEDARDAVAEFVGADPDEVVWTAGATAGLNLVAYAIGNATLGRGGAAAAQFAIAPGDDIVTTEAEHHANLIPWQELAARTGAHLRHIRVAEDGQIDLEHAAELIGARTRIVAFSHVSNVLGIVNPVSAIVELAREVGALTVLDACQSVPHLPLAFHDLDVDFAVFSSHKLFGPDGIGVLVGKRERLNALPPFLLGGSMISHVTLEHAEFLPAPQRFEAGTPPVSGAIGLAAATRFVRSLGQDAIAQHESILERRLRDGLREMDGVRLLGDAPGVERVPLCSFELHGVHAHDAGQYLDSHGIAARVGHHCAAPLHQRYGLTATIRASAAVYNTVDEIDLFLATLERVRPFFGVTS